MGGRQGETGVLLENWEKNNEGAETKLELFKEQIWKEDIEEGGGKLLLKRRWLMIGGLVLLDRGGERRKRAGWAAARREEKKSNFTN